LTRTRAARSLRRALSRGRERSIARNIDGRGAARSGKIARMRRYDGGGRWVERVAIAMLLACNRASDPEEEAPPAAPEPAEDPAPPTPAEPEPPAEPVAGIRIVEPGTEPAAELRFVAGVGSKRRWVVTTRVNTRRGTEPAPLSPRARFEVDTTVTSAGAGWRRELEIVEASILREDDFTPEAIEAAEALAKRLVGAKGLLVVDENGQVQEQTIDVEPGADVELSILVAGLRTALATHVVPLPTEGVGGGASWEATRRAEMHGVESWQVQHVGLRKREGGELELRADLSFPAGPISGQPVGYDPVTVETWTGKGEITSRLDTAHATPIETHASIEIAFTGKDAAGAPTEGKIGIDVTVDEDYLSLKDPRVALRGELSQGGLVRGKVEPGTKVWFEKKRVKVSPEGDFLIGFERDARHRALLSFAFGSAPPERHVIHVAQRTFDTERIDGLPPEMVKLDGKTRTELVRANKRIDKVRSKITDATDFLEKFAWPLKGKLTSTYGLPRILNGEDHGIHWGVDVAAPVGKKVKAPASGVVIFAEDDVPLSGTLLIIDHGFGLTSSFLHLKSIKVAVGDRVKKGQVVALSGNSGRSTGPHLDWRMNLGDVRVDPQLIVGK
jgi:murein DD-endopeptidase MepM/ murein hydrolase activator NlpD